MDDVLLNILNAKTSEQQKIQREDRRQHLIGIREKNKKQKKKKKKIRQNQKKNRRKRKNNKNKRRNIKYIYKKKMYKKKE